MSGIRDRLRSLPLFNQPLPVFDADQVPSEPLDLFIQWLSQAIDAGVCQPHAMTVATTDEHGGPHARILTLKDVDDKACYFTTSASSAKGLQLAADNRVALNFYWRELGRQVRINGHAIQCGPDVATQDFLARSVAARIAGLVGRQSQLLVTFGDIQVASELARTRLTADASAVAEDHAVYATEPVEVEFWQASPDRRHQRLRYRRGPYRWITERLWP